MKAYVVGYCEHCKGDLKADDKRTHVFCNNKKCIGFEVKMNFPTVPMSLYLPKKKDSVGQS